MIARKIWRLAKLQYFASTAPVIDVSKASRLEAPGGELWRAGCASYQDLVEYFSAHEQWLRETTAFEEALAPGLRSFALRGYCAVCRRETRFWANFLAAKTEWRGWREALRCPGCGLVSRLRAMIDFMDSGLALPSTAAVYATESHTSFFRALKRRFRNVVGSQYTPEREPPAAGRRRTRHEDLTKLSFPDWSFDVICTNDVLEHVPDYRAALRECFRCLRPGGYLLINVPFVLLSKKTQERARVRQDGSIQHLQEPEFHDDPLTPEGILCFHNFGWDFIEEIRNAGFADARVHLYWSAHRGYLGVPQMFISADVTAPQERKFFASSAPFIELSAQASRLEPSAERLWQTECASFGDLVDYFSEHAEQLREITAFEAGIAPDLTAFALPGYCAACGRDSRFWANFLGKPTRLGEWRETLICGRCRLASRLRAAIDFVDSVLALPRTAAVYTTELHTPFYRALVERFRNVVGSEYMPEGAREGARHEDLTSLTFADGSFDLICTNDVLEHVPDYRAALRECFRSLRPGGHLVITVPFVLLAQETTVRAKVRPDGTIEHLMEPELHGDPLNSEGVLCFQNFGWDLLDELRSAGFADARVHLYWSAQRAYLGVPQTLITARKS